MLERNNRFANKPVQDAKSLWRQKKVNEAAFGYLFIFPFFLLMFFLTFVVFFMGAMISFTDAANINQGEFIGLQNYAQIFTAGTNESKDFGKALFATFYYAIGCIVTQIPAAFILAYILNNVPKGVRSPLRASFFVPVLINSVVIALLFRMIFSRDTGIINWVLGVVGLPNNTDWLQDSTFAIPLLMIVSFWQWTGFHMVYFLAYLQTIDKSLYEAARIDGASHPRILLQIVLPMMRPAFTFVMVTSLIGGLQMFELTFLVFPDVSYGPGGVAKTLIALIYDEAFRHDFRTGLASALGWMTFFIIFSISLVQLKVFGLGKAAEE